MANRFEKGFYKFEISLFSGEGRQWYVLHSVFAFADARLLQVAGSREDPSLVRRKIEDVRILLENGLGSVAVVNVKVHYQDALEPLGLKMAGCQCDVVE